jgi:hypothetical protein
MSFFDNKEEVLAIELTPHGKNLLNRGILKPALYTFHDDDIIYDPKYVDESVLETPKDIFGRITIDAAYLKPQVRYASYSGNIPNNSQLELSKKDFLLSAYPAGLPIGTSDTNSPYLPAWNLKITNGTIDTILTNKENIYKEYGLNIKVPHIVLQDIIFYGDRLPSEEVLLELEELNVPNTMENFEIEIFIDNKKINFKKQQELIKNGILLDEPITYEVSQRVQTVEDLLQIFVDDEIDFDRVIRGGVINVPDKSNPAPFKDDC